MATTSAHLQANQWGHYCGVLALDGLPHRLTTSDEVSGVDTGFNNGDVYGGLHIVGEIGQKIDPFQPRIDVDSLNFTITDADGVFRALMFSPLDTTGGRTFLSSDFDANDTTANVVSTADFNSSGVFYVGHEQVTYTGKTATTFTGCTRGVNSLFTTNGGTQYSTAHTLRPGEAAGNATAPVISAVPRIYYNRAVALYLCHKEAAWSSKANSRLLWVGRIKTYEDLGNGNIVIGCRSILEALTSTVLTDQFQCRPANDFLIPTNVKMGVRVDTNAVDYDAPSAPANLNAVVIPDAGTYVAIDGLISSLNEQLSDWHDAGTTNARDLWEVSRVDNRVRVSVTTTSAIPDNAKEHFELLLSKWIWVKLGFDVPEGRVTGEAIAGKLLKRVSSTLWELVSDRVVRTDYADLESLIPGDAFLVTDRTGSFVTQPTFPPNVGPGTEGFLQLGDQVRPVSYDSVNARFTVRAFSGSWGFVDIPTVRSDVEGPLLKQVWYERGKAGTLLLQLMLSSGVSTFNHATYDVYTAAGLGLALPASLIDIESFETLDLPYELLLVEPTSLGKLIERIAACAGRYIIFKDGKITLIHPGSDNPNASSTIDVTEDTKGRADDRPGLAYTTEGLINRVVLKYGSAGDTPLENVKDKGQHEIMVEMSHSISDYGTRRTVEIDGTGILDPKSVIEHAIAPMLAYFSRPLATFSCTYNAKLAHIAAGDIVTATFNAVPDPTDGSRGIVNLGAWVTETRFNWKTGVGELTAVLIPDLPQSRYAMFAPSARVDDTQANGGLSGSDKTLTCYAHSYSRSSDTAADASWFVAGDRVHICELSPSDPAAPDQWDRTIDTVAGNAITLTVALSSPTWDSSKKYVIEYSDKSTAGMQNGQLAAAFIADDADGSTGLSANDHNIWSSANNTWMTKFNATSYATSYIKPVTAAYAEGEALSVHKLWNLSENLSNIYNYKTRTVYISEPGALTAETQVGTTYRMVYGPILVPVMGASPVGNGAEVRQMRAKMYMSRTAGAGIAVARLTSSDRMVTGTSDTALTFPGTTVQTSFNSTSSGYEWTTEQTFAPVLFWDAGIAYTFLSVELTANNGTTTAGFKGVWVVEEPLS